VDKVEQGGIDQLPLGAQAFEEHHKLQLEEDHRIDARPATLGVQLVRPLADEAEVKRHLEVAIDVVLGNERF
jgi:hypothetical protein